MSRAPIEDVALEKLDRRYARLRLVVPRQAMRLRLSIEQHGIRQPVTVSTAVEAGQLVLIDGFKRVRAVEELGGTKVPATSLALAGPAAAIAMMQCNVPHRGLSDLEEGWIVRVLCREHKLPQREVAKLLLRDKSWVCRRLALVERLEAALQDDMRLGLLAASAARELARLPRGNQVPCARAIAEHGLGSHQVARLVAMLLSTDGPTARSELLADPLRLLARDQGAMITPIDPRLSGPASELRKAVLGFDGAAARLLRTAEKYAPTGLLGDDARVLVPVLARAAETGRSAVDRLSEIIGQSHGAAPRDAHA